MTLVCEACRLPLSIGESLHVVPVDGSASYLVHRPEALAGCMNAAGPRSVARIALLDPDAARAWDRGATTTEPVSRPAVHLSARPRRPYPPGGGGEVPTWRSTDA